MKQLKFLPNSHKTLKRFFITISLSLLYVAIGFAQPTPNPKTTVTKIPSKSNFVMCEVMPGTEVASKAPYTIPFKNTQPWPTAGIKTGCKYIFKSENDEADIAICLTDLGSSKNALTSYKNACQASKDLWGEDPVAAIILQDTGYFSGKDECGLKFHLGKYVLDINFKGQFPDVSDAQKRDAGIILAGLIMDRLKYLSRR